MQASRRSEGEYADWTIGSLYLIGTQQMTRQLTTILSTRKSIRFSYMGVVIGLVLTWRCETLVTVIKILWAVILNDPSSRCLFYKWTLDCGMGIFSVNLCWNSLDFFSYQKNSSGSYAIKLYLFTLQLRFWNSRVKRLQVFWHFTLPQFNY